MIFDGGVEVYSTCRDCKQRLRVTEYGNTVHPLCKPRQRKVERLADEWLAAVLADDAELERTLQGRIDEIDGATPRFKQSALLYASWGWPVFPLTAGDKTPATAHGFKDATTDVDVIERWWTARPTLNVGLATGFTFDVMDIDPEHGGQWEFLDLLGRRNRKGDNVITAKHGVVTTRSGGLHLYSMPRHRKNGTNIHSLSGIDWRGEGGYVVAPPSVMASGGAWSWMVEPSPDIKGDNNNG